MALFLEVIHEIAKSNFKSVTVALGYRFINVCIDLSWGQFKKIKFMCASWVSSRKLSLSVLDPMKEQSLDKYCEKKFYGRK